MRRKQPRVAIASCMTGIGDGLRAMLRGGRRPCVPVAALLVAVLTTTLVVLLPHSADAAPGVGSRAPSAQTAHAYKAWARGRLGPRQFRALNHIWMRESGWNERARNPGSGAYGIPQALPGRKMRHAGADWKWNGYTQMRWGLHYIRSRYGSPVRAWSFWRRHHWY